mmetsp:Transcript_12529/g.36039  ORF Transcript_12529/g.36039 Transcript_12529/m.36039 type:complete len:243 (-) Transcript_12529:1116-1844(-)
MAPVFMPSRASASTLSSVMLTKSSPSKLSRRDSTPGDAAEENGEVSSETLANFFIMGRIAVFILCRTCSPVMLFSRLGDKVDVPAMSQSPASPPTADGSLLDNAVFNMPTNCSTFIRAPSDLNARKTLCARRTASWSASMRFAIVVMATRRNFGWRRQRRRSRSVRFAISGIGSCSSVSGPNGDGRRPPNQACLNASLAGGRMAGSCCRIFNIKSRTPSDTPCQTGAVKSGGSPLQIAGGPE